MPRAPRCRSTRRRARAADEQLGGIAERPVERQRQRDRLQPLGQHVDRRELPAEQEQQQVVHVAKAVDARQPHRTEREERVDEQSHERRERQHDDRSRDRPGARVDVRLEHDGEDRGDRHEQRDAVDAVGDHVTAQLGDRVQRLHQTRGQLAAAHVVGEHVRHPRVRELTHEQQHEEVPGEGRGRVAARRSGGVGNGAPDAQVDHDLQDARHGPDRHVGAVLRLHEQRSSHLGESAAEGAVHGRSGDHRGAAAVMMRGR